MTIELKHFWKGFIKGKIAVRIETKEQYDSFMDLCTKHNLMWIGRRVSPKEFDVWSIREPELCILCENKMLCQASESDCLRWRKLIIRFVDLKNCF